MIFPTAWNRSGRTFIVVYIVYIYIFARRADASRLRAVSLLIQNINRGEEVGRRREGREEDLLADHRPTIRNNNDRVVIFPDPPPLPNCNHATIYGSKYSFNI